jgi:hypothetical protein
MLVIGHADAQQLVNRSHQLTVGLQDWWRVVPQWYGGTTWRNLMLRNDLTLTGMTTAGAGWRTSAAPGSSGEMHFTGTAGEFLVSSTGMVANNVAFTLVVGYRSTVQSVQHLYHEENNASNNMFLRLRDSVNNQVYFSMRDDVKGCCYIMDYTGGTPVDGLLHYAGIVQSAKDNRIMYFDGVNVAIDLQAVGNANPTARRLGNSFSGSSPLNGAIEEAFVYTRALSAAEMMQLVQSAKQGHPQLLTAPLPSRAALLLSAGQRARSLPFFLR